MISENIEIAGSTGTLEGKLFLPRTEGNAPGVVICHPHSMMGGNMDNNVVLGICSVLVERGYGCLIFNFRGVGKSQGTFDEGLGEVDHTLAAMSFLFFWGWSCNERCSKYRYKQRSCVDRKS